MILQALTAYYEALAAQNRIARPGWGQVRVQYALELDDDGTLLNVLPLESVNEKGKAVPRYFALPAAVKRSSGILPNFLWDNSAYLLGVDNKDKPKRAIQCFEAARELHRKLLVGSKDAFAKAINGFFATWEPEKAAEYTPLAGALVKVTGGANLTFLYRDTLADKAPALAQLWQAHYDGGAEEHAEAERMRCLVTGEDVIPALIHPSIKNVRGAQSSGAALVSFNAPAFCSYDREQNANAPVGKYGAFAYTTALNHLLADSSHTQLIGDTTVVYWAGDGGPQYQDAFGCFMDGVTITNNDLKSVMVGLASGSRVSWDGLPLDPDNGFFVLGLAPNAARLSVRFFLRDTFGDFAKHLNEHYQRLEIVKPDYDKDENLPLWKLLRETVNPNARDKSASPQMAGDTLRSILTGARYPATLYQQTLLRIRAQREVTRGKAAIIKAWLLRNCGENQIKEAASVALNEENGNIPYVLGRIFSLLENIQDSATGASTVKDRYFNSACSTPAAVFPLLLRLKNSHAKVLMREKPGLCVTLDKQLSQLLGRLDSSFPAHLSLEEQGAFILGYYHQTQKRYEKKTAEEEQVNV